MSNKNILLFGGIALILAYCISQRKVHSSTEGKTVETKLGSLKGIISVSRDGREFYEWLGIPYARPPVGPLRFESPRPLRRKWTGVRNATAYGSGCAQLGLISGEITGKENCLFLNIHVPKFEKEVDLLPVLFYIHGGTFMSGNSDQYKPHYFMDEDVILVTVNYRLGVLGFLSTGDSSIRGNMGLKDQSLALKWVYDNINYFGGDPSKITIFGQSAGSKSVHYHMLSPMSRDLMSRAISQSGTALNLLTLQDDPAGQARDVAKKCKCPSRSTVRMAKCLRKLDLQYLLKVQQQSTRLPRTKYTTFAPCVETVIDSETFLGDHPLNLINSGEFAKIPWLAGLVADEGLLYMSAVLNNATYRESLEKDWNLIADSLLFLNATEKEHSQQIQEFYFGSDPKKLERSKDFKSMTNLLTDRWYSYGIYKTVIAHSYHAPVQFYYYTKAGPSFFTYLTLVKGVYSPTYEVAVGLFKNWFTSAVLGKRPTSYGIGHGDELPFLFHEVMGIFCIPKDDANYQFSKDLVKAWVDFATEENFTDDVKFRDVKFPLVDPHGEFKVLNIDDVPKIVNFPIQSRIDFWESIDNEKL